MLMVGSQPGGSQKINQLFDTDSCLPKNGVQSPAVELPMVRHHDLSKGIISSQNEVTSLLPLEDKTGSSQGLRAFLPRDLGQPAHTATSKASRESSGTGNPSSSSTAI
jgi:hypothetical protein